jgi:hypothetical protein
MARQWIALGVAAAAAASVATAALAKPASGAASATYSGEYTCTQGLTGMTLQLRPVGPSRNGPQAVEALVIYYEHPANPGVASGCFLSRGTFDHRTGEVSLDPDRWIYQPSPDWEMTRMAGRVEERSFSGRIMALSGPSGCTTFSLKRGAKPFKPPPKECALPQAIS